MNQALGPSKLKLGVALWIAGMVGVVEVMFLELPAMIAQLPRHHPLRFPMWVVSLGASAESGVVVALFIWMGVALAPKVALHAPAFEALAGSRPVLAALRPQLLPGLIGALLAAVVPWYFTSHGLIIELHTLAALGSGVLYGGIVEELLMRWGLMTLLVWLGWRLVQRGVGTPSRAVMWMGIVASGVLFGAGHLPSTYMLNGHLTAAMVFAVSVGGTVFGVITGYLYWRFGLEAAMICHALSHVFAYLGGRLLGQF